MKRLLGSLLGLGLLLMGSGCQTPSPSSGTDISTEAMPPSPGEQLYVQHCSACHRGYMGQPNRVILDSGTLSSETAFLQMLRQPPSRMMPAFPEGRLSDEQAGVLYQYVVSVREQQAATKQAPD